MRLPAQQMRPVQTHSNTHIDTHTCNCTNQLPQINHPPSPLLATHSSHSVSLLGSICKENIYVKFILLEWHTREHCVCRLCVFITALVCLCLFYNDYRMTFANMFWRKWKRTDIGVKKLEIVRRLLPSICMCFSCVSPFAGDWIGILVGAAFCNYEVLCRTNKLIGICQFVCLAVTFSLYLTALGPFLWLL